MVVPEAGLGGQAEAALEDFKRLHRSKFPVCENLMRRNRWLSAERNLQELEVLGIRVMDSQGDRLTADGRSGLVAKLAEYRLQVISCNWKRGTNRGWGPHLERLTENRYLTRMQLVRLEVLKGIGCIIQIYGINI